MAEEPDIGPGASGQPGGRGRKSGQVAPFTSLAPRWPEAPGGWGWGVGSVLFLLALAHNLSRVRDRNSGNQFLGSEAVLCRARGSPMRRPESPWVPAGQFRAGAFSRRKRAERPLWSFPGSPPGLSCPISFPSGWKSHRSLAVPTSFCEGQLGHWSSSGTARGVELG